MRLSDGKMKNAPGIQVHSAQVPAEFARTTSGISAFVFCKEVKTKWDTTRGVAIHVDFEAVRPNVIRVKFCHFSGGLEKGPAFVLNEETVPVTFDEGDTYIAMTCGELTVKIQKQGHLKFDFYHGDKWLTGSEEGGMAYVTDVDYEAERWCDFNGMPKPVHYMQETYMREELTLSVGEKIYGLGERFTPFIKNGQDVEIWNKDGGTISEQTYKNIPFYLSNRGYGVLVNHPEKVCFNVGTYNTRKVRLYVEGERMEYMVIGGGNPKAVLSNYAALSGYPQVPPTWSFGLWLSTSWTTDYSRETVTHFITKMREYGIPLDVFHYDACWMEDFRMCNFKWADRFGDPKSMLDYVKKLGVKVCVWINPYVGQHSELFQEGVKNGYFLHKKDGSVWQSDYFALGMAIVDFTNPDACKWYRDKLAALMDAGVDVFKTDFAERIPVDVVWHDGSDPKKMHNYYAYLYQELVHGLVREKLGDDDACIFARAATVGCQKFTLHWGGDNTSNYISMAETLRGGLSLCLSGFGFWAHDMSGFNDTATPDLYKRWAAFGMLSTHSRLHGSDSYRVPWLFDEESAYVLRDFARLKCTLMPYLWEQANMTGQTGVTAMRAMLLEYPEDETCAYLDRQYMLGERLLVAPVFSETGNVSFYVPEGRWTSLLDGEVLEGTKWYHRNYDYYSLPLLVRPNTLLAVGHENMTAEYDYAKNVELRAYELEEGLPAECSIHNRSGKEILFASVLKQGGKITATVRGEAADRGWNLVLMNTPSAKTDNGQVSVEGQHVRILPNAGCEVLEIVI